MSVWMDDCFFFPLWELVLSLVSQCHSPGISGRAAQELCGHAGADARGKGLFGDWIPAGEGRVYYSLQDILPLFANVSVRQFDIV